MKQGKSLNGNGTERWYKDGLLHREDGPALINKFGTESWYRDGKYHREDGPAKIYKDGSKFYFLNGKEIKEKDYLKVQHCPLEELALYINTELAPIVKRRLLNETR